MRRATSRRVPGGSDRAARAGKPVRREFDYRRHDTAAMFTVLDVHEGRWPAGSSTQQRRELYYLRSSSTWSARSFSGSTGTASSTTIAQGRYARLARWLILRAPGQSAIPRPMLLPPPFTIAVRPTSLPVMTSVQAPPNVRPSDPTFYASPRRRHEVLACPTLPFRRDPV